MTTAGNDMLKRMQLVYPILTRIQMEVIRSHGFSGDIEGTFEESYDCLITYNAGILIGLMKFCQEIAQLERDDDEIKKLNDDLREIFLPRIPTSFTDTNENGK